MIEWLHTLDGVEIEEPVGFDALELSLIRSDDQHGIGREASTGALRFYGEAAEILEAAYLADGIKAHVIYQISSRCEGEEEYSDPISGRLNFGKYHKTCGNVCFVAVPWEEDSCELILRSRFEQKVDVDKIQGVDGITALPAYANISTPITIPGKELRAEVEGYVTEDSLTFELVDAPDHLPGFSIAWRPTYDDERYNSIDTGQLVPANNYAQLADESIITPQLLLEEIPKCFAGTIEYDVRLKGRVKLDCNAQGTTMGGRVSGWDTTGEWIEGDGAIQPDFTSVFSGDYTANDWIDFDVTFTGAIALTEGQSFFAYMTWSAIDSDDETGDITFEFDPETHILLSSVRLCPDSDAEVSLVHETLSRVTEAITNGCIRVKSNYYGRTDSEPFAFDEDGCGSLRVLTSGLKLRVAPEDKFFISLKSLFDGLNGIDNIGMDVIEDETLPNRFILRVEDVRFFYQDAEILNCDSIPLTDIEVEESRHYSKIQVGYKKWEVQKVNGLDEVNSNREYYTSFDTISTVLNVLSELVAGGYAIEITRQQQFADSGGADTTYDNETFIICVERSAYTFIAERGNIINAANLFSPGTVLNYRITPVRNLMRWFKSIASGYVNLGDSNSKLFFSSGTGNLIAEGQIGGTYTECVDEGGVVRENQNILATTFTDSSDFTPLWKNELISFEYPLSLGDYKRIKAAPYGFVKYQCGSADFQKGWIKEVAYTPAEGKARFTLRKKYQP